VPKIIAAVRIEISNQFFLLTFAINTDYIPYIVAVKTKKSTSWGTQGRIGG